MASVWEEFKEQCGSDTDFLDLHTTKQTNKQIQVTYSYLKGKVQKESAEKVKSVNS